VIDLQQLKPNNDDEPPFNYDYGISFACATISFVFQELNGVCNIYWYIGYYRRYLLDKSKSSLRPGEGNNKDNYQQNKNDNHECKKESKSSKKKRSDDIPLRSVEKKYLAVNDRFDRVYNNAPGLDIKQINGKPFVDESQRESRKSDKNRDIFN
jgi:hypothetical protein